MEAHDTEHGPAHEHLVPYRTYINVWLALVVLTLITVTAAMADLKHMAVFTALFVASVKSTLVLLYFMHLKWEKRIYTWMFLATIFTYVIFLVLTFADYGFRVE